MIKHAPLVIGTAALAFAFTTLTGSLACADDGGTTSTSTFTHDPPGELQPSTQKGRKDTNVYSPNMRFPMESGPAFANSQVYGHGGGSGPGGGQCDKENFSYPWHDNYCETRSWNMPLCPSGQGHQGQDIRAATCEKGKHWVVAAVDGTITQVGSYSVYLTASDGTRYDYLHMQDVAVKEGDTVKREQHLGKVSNQFGGEATTVHLHFNIKQNVAGVGDVYVPPYLSLVNAYEDLLGLHQKTPDPTPVATTINEPAPPAKQTTAATLPEEPPPAPVDADTGCSTSATTGSAPTGTLLVMFGMLSIVIARLRRRMS